MAGSNPVTDEYRAWMESQGADTSELSDAFLTRQLGDAYRRRGVALENIDNDFRDQYLDEIHWVPEDERGFWGTAKSLPGEAWDGLKAGMSDTGSSWSALGAMGAGAVGMEDTEKRLMDTAASFQQDSARNAPTVERFTDVRNVSEFARWIAGTAGRALPSGAEVIGTSMATGGVGGVVAATAKKKALSQLVKSRVRKQGGELREKAIDSLVLAAKKKGQAVGGALGAGTTSIGMNTGEAYNRLYPFTQLDPKDENYLSPAEARTVASMVGVAAGGLDAIVPAYMASKLMLAKPGATQVGMATWFGKVQDKLPAGVILVPAALEGATEFSQEVFQLLGEKYATDEWEFTDDEINHLIDAGAMGVVGGATFSGGITGINKVRNWNRPTSGDGSIDPDDMREDHRTSPEQRREITNQRWAKRKQEAWDQFEVGEQVMRPYGDVGVVESKEDGKFLVRYGDTDLELVEEDPSHLVLARVDETGQPIAEEEVEATEVGSFRIEQQEHKRTVTDPTGKVVSSVAVSFDDATNMATITTSDVAERATEATEEAIDQLRRRAWREGYKVRVGEEGTPVLPSERNSFSRWSDDELLDVFHKYTANSKLNGEYTDAEGLALIELQRRGLTHVGKDANEYTLVSEEGSKKARTVEASRAMRALEPILNPIGEALPSKDILPALKDHLKFLEGAGRVDTGLRTKVLDHLADLGWLKRVDGKLVWHEEETTADKENQKTEREEIRTKREKELYDLGVYKDNEINQSARNVQYKGLEREIESVTADGLVTLRGVDGEIEPSKLTQVPHPGAVKVEDVIDPNGQTRKMRRVRQSRTSLPYKVEYLSPTEEIEVDGETRRVESDEEGFYRMTFKGKDYKVDIVGKEIVGVSYVDDAGVETRIRESLSEDLQEIRLNFKENGEWSDMQPAVKIRNLIEKAIVARNTKPTPVEPANPDAGMEAYERNEDDRPIKEISDTTTKGTRTGLKKHSVWTISEDGQSGQWVTSNYTMVEPVTLWDTKNNRYVEIEGTFDRDKTLTDISVTDMDGNEIETADNEMWEMTVAAAGAEIGFSTIYGTVTTKDFHYTKDDIQKHVDEGKLHLDEKVVSKYPKEDGSREEMSIRKLLGKEDHSSGIRGTSVSRAWYSKQQADGTNEPLPIGPSIWKKSGASYRDQYDNKIVKREEGGYVTIFAGEESTHSEPHKILRDAKAEIAALMVGEGIPYVGVDRTVQAGNETYLKTIPASTEPMYDHISKTHVKDTGYKYETKTLDDEEHLPWVAKKLKGRGYFGSGAADSLRYVKNSRGKYESYYQGEETTPHKEFDNEVGWRDAHMADVNKYGIAQEWRNLIMPKSSRQGEASPQDLVKTDYSPGVTHGGISKFRDLLIKRLDGLSKSEPKDSTRELSYPPQESDEIELIPKRIDHRTLGTSDSDAKNFRYIPLAEEAVDEDMVGALKALAIENGIEPSDTARSNPSRVFMGIDESRTSVGLVLRNDKGKVVVRGVVLPEGYNSTRPGNAGNLRLQKFGRVALKDEEFTGRWVVDPGESQAFHQVDINEAYAAGWTPIGVVNFEAKGVKGRIAVEFESEEAFNAKVAEYETNRIGRPGRTYRGLNAKFKAESEMTPEEDAAWDNLSDEEGNYNPKIGVLLHGSPIHVQESLDALYDMEEIGKVSDGMRLEGLINNVKRVEGVRDSQWESGIKNLRKRHKGREDIIALNELERIIKENEQETADSRSQTEEWNFLSIAKAKALDPNTKELILELNNRRKLKVHEVEADHEGLKEYLSKLGDHELIDGIPIWRVGDDYFYISDGQAVGVGNDVVHQGFGKDIRKDFLEKVVEPKVSDAVKDLYANREALGQDDPFVTEQTTYDVKKLTERFMDLLKEGDEGSRAMRTSEVVEAQKGPKEDIYTRSRRQEGELNDERVQTADGKVNTENFDDDANSHSREDLEALGVTETDTADGTAMPLDFTQGSSMVRPVSEEALKSRDAQVGRWTRPITPPQEEHPMITVGREDLMQETQAAEQELMESEEFVPVPANAVASKIAQTVDETTPAGKVIGGLMRFMFNHPVMRNTMVEILPWADYGKRISNPMDGNTVTKGFVGDGRIHIGSGLAKLNESETSAKDSLGLLIGHEMVHRAVDQLVIWGRALSKGQKVTLPRGLNIDREVIQRIYEDGESLLSHLQEKAKGKHRYALNNVKEMFAHTATDVNFRTWLQEQTLDAKMQARLKTKLTTAWDWLKGVVSRIIGRTTDPNALEYAGELLGQLLNASKTTSKLPREVFYIKDIEVIRNPGHADYGGMTKDARDKFGRNPTGDSEVRFTNDVHGNKWIWPAHEGMHEHIEPLISKREKMDRELLSQTHELGKSYSWEDGGWRRRRDQLKSDPETGYVIFDGSWNPDGRYGDDADAVSRSEEEIQMTPEEHANNRMAVRASEMAALNHSQIHLTEIMQRNPDAIKEAGYASIDEFLNDFGNIGTTEVEGRLKDIVKLVGKDLKGKDVAQAYEPFAAKLKSIMQLHGAPRAQAVEIAYNLLVNNILNNKAKQGEEALKIDADQAKLAELEKRRQSYNANGHSLFDQDRLGKAASKWLVGLTPKHDGQQKVTGGFRKLLNDELTVNDDEVINALKGVNALNLMGQMMVGNAVPEGQTATELIADTTFLPNEHEIVRAAMAYGISRDRMRSPLRGHMAMLRVARNKMVLGQEESVKALRKAASDPNWRDIDPNEVESSQIKNAVEHVLSLREEMEGIKVGMDTVKARSKLREQVIESATREKEILGDELGVYEKPKFLNGAEYRLSRRKRDGDGNPLEELEEYNFTLNLENEKEMQEVLTELRHITEDENNQSKYDGTDRRFQYLKDVRNELAGRLAGGRQDAAHRGVIMSGLQPAQEILGRMGPAGKALAKGVNIVEKFMRIYGSQGRRMHQAWDKKMGKLQFQMDGNHLEKQSWQAEFFQPVMRYIESQFEGDVTEGAGKTWKKFREIGFLGLNWSTKNRALFMEVFHDHHRITEFWRGINEKHYNTVQSEIKEDGSPVFRNQLERGPITTQRHIDMHLVERAAAGAKEYQGIHAELGNLDPEEDQARQLRTIFSRLSPQVTEFLGHFLGSVDPHMTPFMRKVADGDKTINREISLEKLNNAWRNAQKANGKLAAFMEEMFGDNLEAWTEFSAEINTRANAVIKSKHEFSESRRTQSKGMTFANSVFRGDVIASMNARKASTVLPSTMFSYAYYGEQMANKLTQGIAFHHVFGESGGQFEADHKAMMKPLEDAYNDFTSIPGANTRGEGGAPKKPTKKGLRLMVDYLKEQHGLSTEDARKRVKELYSKARAFTEGRGVVKWLGDQYGDQYSSYAENTLSREFLTTMLFGMLNNPKNAILQNLAFSDLVSRFGMNKRTFKGVGKGILNIPYQAIGGILDSLNIQIMRGDLISPHSQNYLKMMTDVEELKNDMPAYLTSHGMKGEINARKFQNFLRKFRKTLSGVGRTGHSGKFVPMSLLSPIFHPFSVVTSMATHGVAVAAADITSSWVKDIARTLDSLGADPNTEVPLSAEEAGVDGSVIDSSIFGNEQQYDWLNGRLANHAHGNASSLSQLAQDYRRRKLKNPKAIPLTEEQAQMIMMIALNDITLEGATAKPRWSTDNVAMQWASPLLNWSMRRMDMTHEQLRDPKDGRLAMTSAVRLLAVAAGVLLPSALAFTFFLDWYDEEVLGKPNNMPKIPKSAMIPFVGIPIASQDPTFRGLAVAERAARANNVYGLGQDLMLQAFGAADPRTSSRPLSLERRVVVTSSFLNAFNAARNYMLLGEADYEQVARPLMYAMGLNSAIHHMQALQHLTGELPIIGAEHRVSNYTGMRASLRGHSRLLGLETKIFSSMDIKPTKFSMYTRRMERAAYANDQDDFSEAWRGAMEEALEQGKPDPIKYVMQAFKNRHLKNGITNGAFTEVDWQLLMDSMPEEERRRVLNAVANHDHYLRFIGGKPRRSSKKMRRAPSRANPDVLRSMAL